MKTVRMLNGETKYFKEVNGELVEVERKGRFTPYYNEDYYFLSQSNSIRCEQNYHSQLDKNLFKHSQIFRTREEAERKAEIMAFIAEKRCYFRCYFTREDFNNDTSKYYRIFVNFEIKELDIIGTTRTASESNIYKKREDAQAVIDFCGFDDYVKYVLEIE